MFTPGIMTGASPPQRVPFRMPAPEPPSHSEVSRYDTVSLARQLDGVGTAKVSDAMRRQQITKGRHSRLGSTGISLLALLQPSNFTSIAHPTILSRVECF